jgi:hypothetical protein
MELQTVASTLLQKLDCESIIVEKSNISQSRLLLLPYDRPTLLDYTWLIFVQCIWRTSDTAKVLIGVILQPFQVGIDKQKLVAHTYKIVCMVSSDVFQFLTSNLAGAMCVSTNVKSNNSTYESINMFVNPTQANGSPTTKFLNTFSSFEMEEYSIFLLVIWREIFVYDCRFSLIRLFSLPVLLQSWALHSYMLQK